MGSQRTHVWEDDRDVGTGTSAQMKQGRGNEEEW